MLEKILWYLCNEVLTSAPLYNQNDYHICFVMLIKYIHIITALEKGVGIPTIHLMKQLLSNYKHGYTSHLLCKTVNFGFQIYFPFSIYFSIQEETSLYFKHAKVLHNRTTNLEEPFSKALFKISTSTFQIC